jgi:hypothetical protein
MANRTKTGGRAKGTTNKTTKEIRIVLKDLINYELENIDTLLSEMQPKERLEIIIKLIHCALPMVENTSYTLAEPLDWDI